MSERSIGKCSNPYWPHSPGETERWQITLYGRPDLAPAQEKVESDLCRVADGSASWLELANTYRSERLQALGNGVVPLTGAIALKVLFERLMNARSY